MAKFSQVHSKHDSQIVLVCWVEVIETRGGCISPDTIREDDLQILFQEILAIFIRKTLLDLQAESWVTQQQN